MKNHVIVYAVFVFFLRDIMCSESDSICTRIERKVELKNVPFVYRVIVPYMTKCKTGPPRVCREERYETRQRFKVFTVENTISVQECCPGYTQRIAETNESSSIKCDPICVPACTNGFCSKPSTCTCNPGYQADPDEYHICHPICSQKCEHGTCEAPDTCKCNFGYKWSNQSCTPICSETCANGSCIAPGTCECNFGYRKASDNTCKPYCSVGCTNGQCVSPENCECDPGFSKETDSICKPICDNPCGNGTCIAPNNCECFPGYKVNKNFDKSNVSQSVICIPECRGCGGYCEEPDTCVCDAIFEENHLGADGKPCDCFRNCTPEDKVCVQTVCSPSSAYLEDYIFNDTTTESNNDYSIHDEDYEYEDYNDYEEVEKVTPNKKSNVVHKHSVEEKSKHSQNDNQDDRFFSIIIYAISLVTVLVVLILVAVLIIFKKKILSFFIRVQYPIEEIESNHLSRIGHEQPANNENNVQ